MTGYTCQWCGSHLSTEQKQKWDLYCSAKCMYEYSVASARGQNFLLPNMEKLQCEWCMKFLEGNYYPYNSKNFCSLKCIEEYKYAKLAKTCAWCGKSIVKWVEYDERYYCSRSCLHKARAKACAWCGQTITLDGGNGLQADGLEFCSAQCYSVYLNDENNPAFAKAKEMLEEQKVEPATSEEPDKAKKNFFE